MLTQVSLVYEISHILHTYYDLIISNLVDFTYSERF
jgi:hypothetical protein